MVKQMIFNCATGEVQIKEYEETPKTQEELTQEKIDDIKLELKRLDKTINRATEDLYILTDLRAYDTVEQVILRKEELRKELQELTKAGE